ncbi:hypothetical protein [Mycoplasmopsis opalescens]|uniref:hypothetical protein n=1 Tax=Mycoplasmopsis opalescens TaxID=114886 RepID=UPI000A8D9B85|nr:hypothetical protein [Mycoplasmopsis opalescens]
MAVIIIKNSNNELELLTVDKHILDIENGEAINFFKGNTKYEVVFKKYIFDGNTYKIVLYDTNQKFFHNIKPGDKLFHFYGSQSMFSWLFNIKN